VPASPAELTAREKHPCAACGAQAEWDPARRRLACPFCGTQAPYETDPGTGAIQEIDLVKTLRELPDELRGWQADRKSVRCQSCRAVSVFDAARVGQSCDFCGSPALVDYDELKAPIRPQSLLPFKIPESEVRQSLRRWLASMWFAPGARARRALVDRLHGVYLPYWTFDAQATCPWQAEAGHYYYETETYRDGQGRLQTRQVQRVRWEPAAGEITHAFDDQPVAGSRGVDPALLRAVEPFPTKDLVAYQTAYLSGFVVEHYQVVLIDAASAAQASMTEALRAMCAAAVPGDTYRNLVIAPRYSGQTFKHILVPAWLVSYTYRGRLYQVVANGHTGRIAGRYPKSAWKILLAVLLALVVLGLIVVAGR
jgi:hypothetical protein